MENRDSILIVDDSPQNIDILVELLGDDYEIAVALSGERAIEMVKNENFDLILLDIMMAGIDGYETCKIIKSMEKNRDIPVLFLTAKSEESSIIRGFEVGGADYVTKPFMPQALFARVRTHLNIRRLIKSLDFLASRDTLTGIYNRRKFFELGTTLFNLNKDGNLFAVMIDIDNFKKINDTYGHEVGDKVIKAVANTISENILDSAIFGRIGGEEFVILCSNLEDCSVAKRVEDCREKIENVRLLVDDEEIRFTISGGISKKDKTVTDIDALLRKADMALYQAKSSGKNRVVLSWENF